MACITFALLGQNSKSLPSSHCLPGPAKHQSLPMFLTHVSHPQHFTRFICTLFSRSEIDFDHISLHCCCNNDPMRLCGIWCLGVVQANGCLMLLQVHPCLEVAPLPMHSLCTQEDEGISDRLGKCDAHKHHSKLSLCLRVRLHYSEVRPPHRLVSVAPEQGPWVLQHVVCKFSSHYNHMQISVSHHVCHRRYAKT